MMSVRFLTLFLFPFALFGQEVIRLEDAIRIGLENNYSIKIADNDRSVLENNVTPGNAGFLPLLDVAASQSFGRQDFEQVLASGATREGDDAKTSNLNANAVLNWTLFDGTGMFIAWERLRETREQGDYNFKVTVQNYVAQLTVSFYNVVAELVTLNALRDNIDFSKRRLDIAQNKYEVGRSAKSEYLQARVDFNTDSSAIMRQEQQLKTAKINLNRLLSRDPATEFEIDFRFEVAPMMSLEDLRNSAVLQNPELLAAQRSKNLAYLSVREIQSERWPTLGVNLGYTYGNSTSQTFFLENQSQTLSYGATARLNLFNGFNLNRRIRNAKLDAESADLSYRDQRLQLEADLETAYGVYLNSLRVLELETQNLEVAKENSRIALDRYQLGNISFLEVRQAQNNEVQAEIRSLNARYAIKLAELELTRLSGNLIK
jgi:outer membrane protein TolC